jgi:acyl-CoA thioesterase FadM
MLLFFRFLITLVKGGFRSRIGPLDPSVVHFRALPQDCDLNLHLNAGRYVSFMDVARSELFARRRVFRTLLRRGWRPIMGGATVTYRRSVLPFERFSVTSRLMAWDDKWLYLEQLVHKGDGTLSATGIVRMLLGGKGGEPSPREVLTLLGIGDIPSPEIPR